MAQRPEDLPAVPGPGSSHDPLRLRVSDRERHAVAEVLREAAGEGRLDLTELEERLEATYAARTYAELVPLTADLPIAGRAPGAPSPGPPGAGAGLVHPHAPGSGLAVPAWTGSFAMMSETRRSGVWDAGPTHWAFAGMGSVVLDLRQARFLSRELLITASAVMGSVEVVVGPAVHVVVDGVGIMGSFCEARSRVEPEPRHDSPVVRVRGVALMGSVEVKRKGPGKERRARPR
jgi:hypothetical protein